MAIKVTIDNNFNNPKVKVLMLKGEKGEKGDTGDVSKEELNDVETNLQSQINSLASGSPLVASSISEMTDTTRIYVLTTDGHWYWYDGVSWEDGGTYQSTGIANHSIDGIKTTFFNNSVNKLRIDDASGTGIGGSVAYTIVDGVITLNGTASNTGYIDINTTNSEVLKGVYRLTLLNTDEEISGVGVSFMGPGSSLWYGGSTLMSHDMVYNFNSSVVQLKVRIESGTELDNLVLKPMIIDETKFYDLPGKIGYKSHDELYNTEKIFDIGKKVIDYDNTKFMSIGKNIVNPNNLFKNTTCTSSSGGDLSFVSDPRYKCFVYFNTTNETQRLYIYPRYRAYHILNFSNTGQPTTSGSTTETSAPSFVDVTAHSEIAITLFTNDTEMVAISSEAIPYEPFKYNIDHVQEFDIVRSDKLYNKKLVACGDSFTEYTNATFESGPYYSKYKTWPYLIGLRNNMIVNNMAVSGSTMTTISGDTATHFSDTLYTQIPNDADYIIIKYGINDENKHATIGTISDNTNNTFYGAWNIVMSYIIEHYPTAKIGIIVTNGLTYHGDSTNGNDYANAIIEIAKKYGIPTLNEWNDPNVPLLLRTGRNDVSSTIRNIRHNTFRISSDNTHENYICQEYESTFIEDFLRRL